MAKNAPKKHAEEAEQAEEAPPKKKGNKLLLVLVLLIVLGAVGGAAWFFVSKHKSAAATAASSAPQPEKPPVFVALEPFTVNLQPESGDQYLQVAVTLRVLDDKTADSVKTLMPEIRHRTLLLLSSKKASQISSVAGRERLAAQMRRQVDLVLWEAQGITPPAQDSTQPIGDAAAAGGNQANASAAPAPGAPAASGAVGTPAAKPAADKPIPAAAPDDPVQNVFFTSFIIQ